ncbi:MAG TPA: aminotransferase class V-fold PLP-dependent enzyme [Planctomycetaceae bacterium]|jgi:glutamate/tyrosine decarboxylase-like PLP-dependent enzyme
MSWDQLQHEFDRVQADLAEGPILPSVTVEEIRSHLAGQYDFQKELPLDEVIQDAQRMLSTWQVQVTHPRYLGLFNPAVTLPSVIGETLAAMYNSQLANWRTSPVGNEIERHTLGWLAAKFGLPENSIATFTSGGSEANLSAVAVALSHAFPEYGEHGLSSLPARPSLYLTGEAHHGFNKIAHMTGIGRRAIRPVETDRRLKLDLDSLRRQVRQDCGEGWAPFMVVGTAGTTAAGVIDPLPEMGQFCRDEGLWFHVDAAWGGAAILSPELKATLAGIEYADSITWDAHKWLSVPMGCGMFFCRHRESVARAFHADVTYMSGKQSGPVFDPLTNSTQWSRRFIGLKLFLALANLGESGYAAMIEHQVRLGNVLRQELTASGWRIVNETPLPLVCFTREHLDTTAFIAALHRRQIAWISEARLDGTPVLRACISNYRTTEAEIHQIVDEMNQLYQASGTRHSALVE